MFGQKNFSTPGLQTSMPVDFSRLAVDHGMLSAVGPQATVVWDVLEEAEESTDETAAEGEVSGPGHLPACQGGSAVGAWGRGEEGHENSPATVGLSKKSYTMNGHGYKDSTQLLKYLDLEGDAYGSVVDGALPDPSKVNAIDVRINENAVQALRENQGPLQKLDRLRDEIANFKELFGRKKTMEAKIAAAGKRKIVHLDKTKLVQLDKKFYYEMHHEFDLYESLRLGRFVYNTPYKAERVAGDQRAVEERVAEELRVAMEAAALRIQALNRGKRAREEALRLRQQQMAAQRDTRSSRGSSCRSSRVPSRPPSAPADPNTPLSPWDLFCMFCAGGDPQDAQGSKKAKTMDYKEWVNMLHYLAVFDKRVKKQKAAEIFKQANRGVAGDGDHNELDWDEFEFAFRKLAEHLGLLVSSQQLSPGCRCCLIVGDQVDQMN